MANYADKRRYARLIPKPNPVPGRVHAARPIDLVKLRRSSANEYRPSRAQRFTVEHTLGKVVTHGIGKAVLSTSVTGIWPWWTYEARSIPGTGQAMVNVATLNFLLEANDLDIPAAGLDLAFRRVYNSLSNHDVNGADGSTPSVYGNRWTNNLDVHLGWSSGNSMVSVYTANGARADYTCTITQAGLCTSQTPGVNDLLATTQLNGSGIACQLQWTKKSGTTYVFDAPYPDCTTNDAGYYGRLLAIYARNINFSLQLAYSWTNGNDHSAENLAKIVVTHEPDDATLTLNFGQIANTSYTELMQIVRPDGPSCPPTCETINYHYTSNGELADVDKPGNDPVLPKNEALPSNFLDGAPIAQGNLPETYDVEHPGLMEVCGPRAAISIIDTNQNPADGACVDFDYNNRQLTDWYTRGVLDPTPADNVSPSPIQTGPGISTGFVQWNDTTYVQTITSNCEGGVSNSTYLSDVFMHEVIWCYDSSSRVFQTQVFNYGEGTVLNTEQAWDSNNNLVSTTDPRGNTTNMAYDANGNTLEVSLPQQLTSKGTIRPTSLYDYDSYNNVLDYCDPANNPNNSWNPSPGPSPCANSGSTHYAQYTIDTSDPNEPYGCLVKTQTPSGYLTKITFGNGSGDCGFGLPTLAKAAQSFNQDDGNSRRPTQTFGYNANWILNSYDGGNGAWGLTYTSDGMNRVKSRADPDGVTSYSCYNLDGSIFYTETAYQHKLDGGGGSNCPTDSQLLAGATPPLYAVSNGYDADGDVATELHHHNCTLTACNANLTATTNCYGVSVSAGATCNFYDGLDRLVEVKQPYDSSLDLYSNPWITRYLYDLTGNQDKFGGQYFQAYGNLFMTQELLPSGSSGSVTVTAPLPRSVSNTAYQDIKATAFDALDRPVAKYSLVAAGTSEQTNTETLTWDTSPLDPGGVAGLLGKDCNAENQCQEFDYLPDGEKASFATSGGGGNQEPQLAYTYDPDGRPVTIATSAYNNPQEYSYDVDGRMSTSTDPSGAVSGNPTVSSPATITHNYYADGTLESIDVSSTALSQTGLFEYSYRNDGQLEQEQLNDSGVTGSFPKGETLLQYTYTSAGRMTERDESGVGARTAPTKWTYDLPNSGLETSDTFAGGSLSLMTYSAESELLTLSASGSQEGYTYTLRGEHACSFATCPYRVGALQANGLAVQQQLVNKTGQSWQYQWDFNMAVMTGMDEEGCGSSCTPSSSWTYDSAGRQTLATGPIGTQLVSGSVSRLYDAENHLTSTGGPFGQASYSWGPNGHPLTIGPSGSAETLHWDGNQMLFATRNGQNIVDDIKIDVQGDVLPQDPGYPGLTFFDRGPGGVVMGCHHAGTGAATFAGLGDVWIRGWGSTTQDTSPCYQSSGGMPTSIDWYGTPLISGSQLGGMVGQGGVLGMPRTDGLTDNLDTIQGVRSYDSTAGTWTCPDANAGVVQDPGSQKSYMWDGNNPVAYDDPSGYEPVAATGLLGDLYLIISNYSDEGRSINSVLVSDKLEHWTIHADPNPNVNGVTDSGLSNDPHWGGWGHISIWSTLSPWQQLLALSHELGHALFTATFGKAETNHAEENGTAPLPNEWNESKYGEYYADTVSLLIITQLKAAGIYESTLPEYLKDIEDTHGLNDWPELGEMLDYKTAHNGETDYQNVNEQIGNM